MRDSISGTTTEKAATAHGEVEYTVVDCANCGNDAKRNDAVAVHLDPEEKECRGSSICDATHPYPQGQAYLCQYCAESIFGYSRRIGSKVLFHGRWDPAVAVIYSITAFVLALLVILVAAA